MVPNDYVPNLEVPNIHHDMVHYLTQNIHNLLHLPERFQVRAILITLIDCEIIYDSLNNAARLQVDELRNEISNEMAQLQNNSVTVIDDILQIVQNATHEQKQYLYNYIKDLYPYMR